MTSRPRPFASHPSRWSRRCTLTLATLLLAAVGKASAAGGLTPDQARERMTVPDGFQVQTFASEPEIRQPVAATFDERGRMWVIEYLQYPVPAGLKPVTVDQYLRTEYDRVPEPPPKGPRGVDRIKILEDTNGDGKADKVTTFLEGLNLATGLAVGHGGVFIAQAPYLLFYPDGNKDDKPDGDPEVLLSGFGLQDAHALVNSLMWGPDGWLYGAQGSTVTAKIRGTEFQQGVWRYHPGSKRFELFAEGGGNTWGLDFDRAGNAFGSSNGGFVAFHMVQGGYYWKGFAKHGPLHNPNTFGYFNSLEYQGVKPGGHVTPGGIIYKGDQFPREFDGAFLGCNLLANTVYWYTLTPKGSSFTAQLGGTLLDSHDPWFRPIDLLTGPDGSVYVVDWYDKRASHLDPRDNWDKTNGRIYKISYKQPEPVKPFDLAMWSSEDLVNLRTSGNDWWPDMARRILAERADPKVVPTLKGLLDQDRDEPTALRDLWALDVSGGLDDATALRLLDHSIPGVRRWVARRLGDRGDNPNDALRDRLIRMAREDGDPLVRSQLAASCQRWPFPTARPILLALIARSEDLNDPHIPLLIWWAIERQMRDDPTVALAFTDSSAQQLSMVTDHLLERISRALLSRGKPADLAACGQVLDSAVSQASADKIIAGMNAGLEGRRPEAMPAELVKPLDQYERRFGKTPGYIRLGVRLGSTSALRTVMERALDPKTPTADRVALIDLIGQVAPVEGLEPLTTMLRRKESDAVHLAVLNALGHYTKPEVADAVLAEYPKLPESLRDRVRGLLCSRTVWAGRLLDAMADGRVSPKDLRRPQVLQVVQLGDSALTARLEKVWGRLPGPNSAAKVQRIAEVRGILPEGDKGDPARGRPVFQQHCAVCHSLFGEGEKIGPDLTGAERGDLDFLLTSMVDPSALIRKEYEAQTLALDDGRVLSGLIVEENEKTITLVDSQRQKIIVPKDEVQSMKPSEVSLMPEGLLDPLPDNQVRDLFRYLRSSGPPK